ncbi:MAG: biopolymer transporter ExbD [Deltaproteobacteria bacterium]|nr:biopolymer transporter ExbD [Deltaproteobacteria bacterium]MBW2081529.1 biopolymer transporter ExbD [Deltaproteobacteria bacterium]HDM10476.1 biopolymer transporter ExbD [Desulfobacteraceae bacterium]
MKFSKVKEEEPRLGIAPLVDIVFLLLIFFMLTSHFEIASGVPIRLPKVTQKIFNTQEMKVTVLLDRTGKIYFHGKKLTLGELRKKMEKLVEENGIVHLILQADQDTRHGRVVDVMDVAKSAGIRSIIIAARWKSQ